MLLTGVDRADCGAVDATGVVEDEEGEPLPAGGVALLAPVDDEEGMVEMRRSLPRPLMPLFEFLYSEAKYSNSSLSWGETASLSRIDANLDVRKRSIGAWNLFWWDWLHLLASRGPRKLSVLAYLQVSKLRELLATAFKLAGEGLDVLVHDLVRPYVATLGKRLTADVAVVWSLASVATFVSLVPSASSHPAALQCRAYLEVSELRESLAT